MEPVVEQQLVLFSLVAPLSLPVFSLGHHCVQRSLLLVFRLHEVCAQQMLQVLLGQLIFCPLGEFQRIGIRKL